MKLRGDMKYCPGLIHLRAVLRAMVKETGAPKIRVYDGVDVQKFDTDEPGVMAAANYAPDVDGIVYYSIGKATIQVLYDGPYSEENFQEIINDANEVAATILQ